MKTDPEYLKNAWGYCHRNEAGCDFGRVINDGYMTTVYCRIKGDYARCEACEMNRNAHNFIEVEGEKE